MTKADLVERVTAQISRTAGPMISKKDCARVVDAFLDAIKEALQEQKNIEVRGFGTFKIRHRKTRMARNPRTGSPVEVSARPVPVFKPSKELRAMVAESRRELYPRRFTTLSFPAQTSPSRLSSHDGHESASSRRTPNQLGKSRARPSDVGERSDGGRCRDGNRPRLRARTRSRRTPLVAVNAAYATPTTRDSRRRRGRDHSTGRRRMMRASHRS